MIFCPECAPCPCCDGGELRYPRRWRLDIRPDGELRAQCSLCLGSGYVCTEHDFKPSSSNRST